MKFDATLMAFVSKDLEHGSIPMLLGEPGIGKSSWVEALAKLKNTKCFTLPCNQLADKADLTGARLVPVQTASGETTYKQVFYPHAVIHDAIEYAQAHPREMPILFLDELNRTTPDVTSEALSIPTLRAIGSVKLPSNLSVICAGNDKGNITSLDEASISRFVLYHVTPDVQTFLSLDPSLNVFVAETIKKHPDLLFCKESAMIQAANDNDDDNNATLIEEIIDDGENMSQLTTPRTISSLSRWLNTFTNQELLQLLNTTTVSNGETISVLQEAIAGHIGATPFMLALMQEISSSIMNVSNQKNVVTFAKPPYYDDLKSAPTLTDMKQISANMTPEDRGTCLVYALYEKADNTTLIETLTSDDLQLKTDIINILAIKATSNELDAENVHALLRSNAPILHGIQALLMQY